MKAQKSRKLEIWVCSGSDRYSLEALISTLEAIEGVHVSYEQLPYNVDDMDKFKFKTMKRRDVLILAHSINNRRFSITNVTDSLYDGFLRKAKKTFKKKRVGVVVYDFPKEEIEETKLRDRMESFRSQQERTFRKADLVLIGGKLETGKPELTIGQIEELNHFVERRLQSCVMGC